MKYMMLRGAGMALWASPDACILVEQLASRRQHRGTESDALRRGYGTLSWPSYMQIGEVPEEKREDEHAIFRVPDVCSSHRAGTPRPGCAGRAAEEAE